MEITSNGDFIMGGSSLSGISGDKTEPFIGDHDYWIVKISSDTLATSEANPLNEGNLLIYPNPVIDKLVIHGRDLTISGEIKIFDLLGKTYQPEVNKINPNEVEIILSEFDPGLYILSIGSVKRIIAKSAMKTN